jgi:hypothetical membrane protein
MRLYALLWTACIQFFIAEQVVRLAWTLPYSFAQNYISDLGADACSAAVCSPWHALMNASFVLQGVLIAGGATLAWRHWRPLQRVGLALLEVCGAGVIVVGLVPENANPTIHNIAAAAHFLGGGFGIIAVGVTLKGWFRWMSVITGVLVVAAVVEVGRGGETLGQQIGIGALERAGAYGITAWMVVLGIRCNIKRTTGENRPKLFLPR